MNSKNDSLDIDDLSNSEYWEGTKKIYRKNKCYFDSLSEHLAKIYGLDSKLSQDSVLYEIMSVQYKNNRQLFDANLILWIFIYLIVFLFILVSGFFSIFFSFFKKKNSADVIYEEMWPQKSLYNRFYDYIDVELSSRNIKRKILLISPGIGFFKEKVQAWNGSIINRRYSGALFEYRLSFQVFFCDLFYLTELLKISRKSGVNYIYIYLRLLRKVLMYHSQSSNIKASVLVSAGDYYWNPIKYHMYKRNIENIILLQHNHCDDYLHVRMFQYCDYYYAHSQQSIDKHVFCGDAEFFNVGSFQLIPYITDNELEYDIVFVSQTVFDNLVSNCKGLDQSKLQKSYQTLVANFHSYLKNNPSIKAIYMSKTGYGSSQPAVNDKETFEDTGNILFVETNGKETFNFISRSKVIINMYSTVGFESYGLNKKVLWINYDGCCDIFNFNTDAEDMHVMTSNTTYEAFEDRLNLLLSESDFVDEHYKGLKEKYMNVQKNPAKIVAMNIENILNNKSN